MENAIASNPRPIRTIFPGRIAVNLPIMRFPKAIPPVFAIDTVEIAAALSDDFRCLFI